MLTRRAAVGFGAAVLLILFAYVLYPSIELFATGLRPEVYRRLFSSWASANVRALWNSSWVSLASVAGAGVTGTGLAYFLSRYDFPLRRVMRSLAVLPLALPPLVGVIAFLFLYGESGILPRGLQRLFALDYAPLSFEGIAAIWLVHVYSMYVYFYLFVTAALAGVDRSLYEASNDLGASGVTTFRRVILPLLRPALLGASLLVFMISMASFTAPLIFAGTEPFLTLQVFNYKMNGNIPMSAGAATVLTIICLLFLVLIERSGRAATGAASKGLAAAATPVRTGAARLAVFIACGVFILFLLLPIATIVMISFAEEGSWTYQILPARYTVYNYVALFREPDVFAPIMNSLQMALLATVANVLFGVVAAVYIVKTALPGRHVARALSVLPFAIPGTVIAVNLIVAFNTPTVPGLGRVLVGSFWILPLAYFIRNIPLVVRATTAALEGYDDRLSEASFDLGAGYGRTFFRIVLPLLRPAILAGAMLSFVAALGEFVASILLYIYENRPISVEILAQLRLYDFGAAAAYAVLLMVLIAVSSALLQWTGASSPTRAGYA